MCCVSNCGTLPTSLPKARQERGLHHAVIEGLSDAVVVPQGLVVQVHQGTLQLPDLRKQTRVVLLQMHVFPLRISDLGAKVVLGAVPGCGRE